MTAVRSASSRPFTPAPSASACLTAATSPRPAASTRSTRSPPQPAARKKGKRRPFTIKPSSAGSTGGVSNAPVSSTTSASSPSLRPPTPTTGCEGAVEREEGSRAGEGVVVVAETVEDGPRAQDRDCDAGAGHRAAEPRAPWQAEDERQRRDQHEHLERGAGERGRRSRRAEDGEPSDAGRDPRTRGRQRPHRERGRGDGLARRRVEQDPEAGIREKRDRGHEGRARAERERRPRPQHHRGGEQQRHHHEQSPASEEVECPPDHERRQRGPEEHGHRDDRVPVPHLNVVADVRPEVAPWDDGEREASQTEHYERQGEDRRPAPLRLDPGFEPVDRVAHGPPGYGNAP